MTALSLEVFVPPAVAEGLVSILCGEEVVANCLAVLRGVLAVHEAVPITEKAPIGVIDHTLFMLGAAGVASAAAVHRDIDTDTVLHGCGSAAALLSLYGRRSDEKFSRSAPEMILARVAQVELLIARLEAVVARDRHPARPHLHLVH